MENLKNFITKWQSVILAVLFCFIYLGQCSTNRTIRKMRKDNLKLNARIDSLNQTIKNLKPITKKDLQIEGLKAEKRMLQSVSRKIIDVNRQAEIDKEIKELEKNE